MFIPRSYIRQTSLNIKGLFLRKDGYSKYDVTLKDVFFFFNLCDGTLGTAATTVLLYQPKMIGDGDCGYIGGMKIGRGN
jgi:hypothetical protein